MGPAAAPRPIIKIHADKSHNRPQTLTPAGPQPDSGPRGRRLLPVPLGSRLPLINFYLLTCRRVPTLSQNPDSQPDALNAAACDEIFAGQDANGKLASRRELDGALADCGPYHPAVARHALPAAPPRIVARCGI